MSKNFHALEIWKRSRKLVSEVYLITKDLPDSEKYGLTSQLRRAAISVPSNIAEGCGRNHDKELIQFLYISVGSLCEIETQFYLLFDLNILSKDDLTTILDEVVQIRKMIYGYIKSI